MSAAKHRAGVAVVEHGWTPWPRHRSLDVEPSPSNGLEEMQRKWFAAMKVRAVANRRRQMAWLS